ncbi:alpha-glucan family phosphorylase [bacterium]|nr:alpha-glucan family phosphorylase [bacterium]MBU1983657.1 alpha-glucan family phosphorylase [bacterium]
MKVKPLAILEVVPAIPEPIAGLRELAYNLLWSWNPDIAALFRSLDPETWQATGHNPAKMLRVLSQRKLDNAVANPAFLDHYHRCKSFHDHYLKEPGWFDKVCGHALVSEIVYFSMEYGLSESLPVYSGGLGVLSGDHVKSASDLGLPLVGIGLAYRQGYFQQQITAEGFQTEVYPENDFESLPVTKVVDEKGERLKVSLSFPGRTLFIGALKVKVGRVPLYLLDTDLPENSPADRRITYMLYGGDKETRIQQEIVLGMGGVELLRRLGIPTTVCHMNEGHSAFIQLARIAHAKNELDLTPWEAIRLVSAGTVFTTHTPVPAGIDQFPPELMDRYFSHLYVPIGLTRDEVLALGSKRPGVSGQLFNMAIFAMKTASATNGVSRLHGDVSRSLWEESWPNLPHDEIPVDYVTNGIHLRTWISDNMAALFDRHLGPEWRRNPDHKDLWERVRDIPDEDLWMAHAHGRQRLVEFVRQRLSEQRARTSGVEMSSDEAETYLDPRLLTIGFARRFATYKRATLLLRYPDRLLALLRDSKRPIQIVFAGKAHPADDAGKALIHDIIYFARSQNVAHRLVFLENYDMVVGRMLVQGVDVWLNNPRRPLEASGTSGMKVLGNGGLNLSILDGWWDEAYAPGLGWAIGRGKVYGDDTVQDDRDAQSLFEMIEKHIVPLFYTHDDSGLPRRWIARMKDSIAELVPRFNSVRMVKEYCQDYYAPALERCHQLQADNCNAVRQLAAWKNWIRANWEKVKIVALPARSQRMITSGTELEVVAKVELGPLTPGDVEVHVYYGPLHTDGTIAFSGFRPMEPHEKGGGSVYRGTIVFPDSGKYGYTVRVIPYHPLLGNPLQMGLAHWAGILPTE